MIQKKIFYLHDWLYFCVAKCKIFIIALVKTTVSLIREPFYIPYPLLTNLLTNLCASNAAPHQNQNTMENVANPVRYSDTELEEFRELIINKLEKANQELDFMQTQLTELSESTNNKNSADLFDDSSLHTEIEMMSRMIVRQQQFVRNLDAALVRVRNKTYGICAVTGQLIDKKRLQLVPHATKSVLGKEEEKKTMSQEPFGGAYSSLELPSTDSPSHTED